MQVDQQQRALTTLTGRASADLTSLSAGLLDGDPATLAGPLAEALQAIGERYGTAAAALGADWYETLREGAGETGLYVVEPAALPTPKRWQALAGWGITPLFGATPDATAALALLVGGLARSVVNAHRGTVVGAAAADPATIGWARHASAHACAFCRMLATRGAVYWSQGVSSGGDASRARRSTSHARGSRYHDHCHCLAVPSFARAPYRPAPYVQDWQDQYDQARAAGHSTSQILAAWRANEGLRS